MKKFSGVIPPVITSFDKNGKINESAQREVIKFLKDKVHGFYPVGTYGSGPLMSAEERKRVAKIIIDEVDGALPVMVHVGAINTEQAVELAHHAELIGADAIGAIPPFYYRYPKDDLLNYFRSLIKAVKIPVYAYNNPGLSNNPLTSDLIKCLADEGLSGIKDSSFDIVTFYEFLQLIKKENFVFIIGTEAIAAPAIQAGGQAIISGLANVWPELMTEFWDALSSNDNKRIGEMQLKVNNARAILKYGPTLVVCYEVLKARGIDAGYPRQPYSLLNDETRKKILSAFTEMGLLHV